MPKRRVVLDTNVLVSSLWGGRCWDVVKLWRDGRVMLAVSPNVLKEYLEVLSRFLTPDLLQEWVLVLTDTTLVTSVEAREPIAVIREDPADNRFLECAIAAQADAIVTGDHHLLNLKRFRGIPILRPTAFLRSIS